MIRLCLFRLLSIDHIWQFAMVIRRTTTYVDSWICIETRNRLCTAQKFLEDILLNVKCDRNAHSLAHFSQQIQEYLSTKIYFYLRFDIEHVDFVYCPLL